jgi:simple sugar transport system substrate-binding protein
MSSRKWMFVSILVLISMVFSACTPAATPTAAPAAPTQAPAATTAPAAPVATTAPAAPVATTAPAAPAATTAPAASGTPFTFGMVLVGPYNDSGWSQATYDGGQYVVSKVPNTKMVYVDLGFSHQGVTPAQLAEQLVSQGAKLIIFNSDDFKDDSNTFAKAHPDIPTIMLSGDQAWQQGQAYLPLPNMVNIMGRMEYTKMIAGCAAALTTQTGQIGYLGPLINAETRRLASSAYLGAKYCWTNYLKKDPAQLKFKVTWIGYWFNEPGITLDPTKVADDFFNSNYDVVMSGIDTTEALTEAKKLNGAGKKVWAVSYDYKTNCSSAPDVCLGVPYFNWGPGISTAVQAAIAGKFTESWSWNGPDWTNINNPDTGAVGFNKGQGLSGDASATLDKFIAELAGGLNLWKGPLNLQDKTVYLKDGEAATDQQIWYLPQLLEGMDGQSVSK